MDRYPLKFDEMVVDTSLAKEYLERNKSMFEGFEILNSVVVGYDNHNKRLTYRNAAFKLSRHICDKAVCNPLPIKSDELRSLAEKIDENSELFCQLEYLRTSTPIDEVKNFDLKLIVEHLRNPIQHAIVPYKYLIIDNCMPLWVLGNIATCKPECNILCNKESAMVAHLFFALCREVGFNQLGLIFIKEFPKHATGDIYWNLEKSRDGCSVIVTEHADIDSAIDGLLLSTDQEHYPWVLKRVLVQENIYEVFQNKLAAKATEKPSEDELKLATKVYASEKKTFIIDFLGNKTPDRHILVQAYRTNKELLALLKEFEFVFSIVWSQDISEANEIVFKTKANFIWINSGVAFKYPMAIDALYATFQPKYIKSIVKPVQISKLSASHKAWLSYSVEKRKEVIYEAIDSNLDKFENDETISDFIKASLHNYNGNFVEISNDSMCVGVSKPTGLACYQIDGNGPNENFVFLMKALAVGNGLVLFNNGKTDEDLTLCFEILEATGVPVTLLDKCELGDFKMKMLCSVERKVVWSNYGTIFAN